MKAKHLVFLLIIMTAFLSSGCERKKNPSRDEIPPIKDVLGKFQRAVADKNAAAIDSLFLAEAYDLGYYSGTVLETVYPDSDSSGFFAFGRKEFFYTKNKAVVTCFIMADSADTGRRVEITLEKDGKNWYLKRFDLKP